MFEKYIKYCISRLENNILSLDEKRMIINDNILEDFLFTGISAKNQKKLYKVRNQLYLSAIILNEIKNIRYFQKVSEGDLKDFISPYGSLYFGTDVFYYNDDLINYNEEQFYQIILNHICHYMLGYTYHNINDIKQKSNILLMLDNIGGIINTNIVYAQLKRDQLYNRYINIEEIQKLILFGCKNMKKYMINNSIENNFFYKKEKSFIEKNIFITQAQISFSEK